MAFEDCELHTIDVCSDCIGHLANGEAGCCHADDRDGDRPCPTAVRLLRRWRDTDITPGCGTECCDPDGDRSWFTWSACEGCGVALGGDRTHATAWVRRDTRPDRTLIRHGWRVSIRHTGAQLYAVAERDGATRYCFDGAHDGAQRWQRMAEFVATLAA